ncbi:MAG: hypothetical protein MMC33_000813 [Icmadophila ericetorum]|nr:hypothetical protein [Icmadophila ericetorum]
MSTTNGSTPESIRAHWPAPNYVNPPSSGNFVVAITCIFLALSVVLFGVRIYARAKIVRHLGWDDALAACALLVVVGFDAVTLYSIDMGLMGHHIWDTPPSDLIPGYEALWFAEMFFNLAQGLIKISVCMFYRRLLLGGQHRLFSYTVNGMLVYQVISTATCVLVLLNTCRPLNAYWLRYQGDYENYTCINDVMFWFIQNVLGVITDIIIVLLPCRLVASLYLGKRQKQALYGIFGLGFILCVAGIFRLILTIDVDLYTEDTTWVIVYLNLASIVELNCGLICASAPAIKPMFDKYILKARGNRPPTPAQLLECKNGKLVPVDDGKEPFEVWRTTTTSVTNTEPSSPV